MCRFGLHVAIIVYVTAIGRQGDAQRHKTIYQKIQQEQAYSGFGALVRNNKVAKFNFHFDNLTVFVPENKAFNDHPAEFRSEIAFYHISFEVKRLEKLRTTRKVLSADANFPPLWITKSGRDIYVNNARILPHMSDQVSTRRSGASDNEQVLHVIDEVLDPVIPSPDFQPSAYDFLSSVDKWQLDATKTVTSFFHKVLENNLADVYKLKGAHTFFVPVDSGIDPRKFKMINRHTIYGHVILNSVLFTRPTEKNSPYSTMANDRFIYIVVSFEEKDGKVFVRGLAGGDLGNGNGEEGEFVAEIILPNIPVKNGVVHLVSQPLGIFNRTLRPFPYRPVLEKVANDPDLAKIYDMGERTGFNKKLEEDNVKFTYFAPKDVAWIKARQYELEPTEDELDILNRHLIVSDATYSMERLLAMSRANNYTDIELNTEAGPIRVTVLKIDTDYYVKWGNKYIRVVKPDYECSNGIVHVLAGPITRFRSAGGADIPGEIRMGGLHRNFDNTQSAIDGYWKTLGNVWRNIF